MNKGIPYLLAGLVALMQAAGWTAPVLALFTRVRDCLATGAGVDLLFLRCQGLLAQVQPGALALWLWCAVAGVAVLVLLWSQRQRAAHR